MSCFLVHKSAVTFPSNIYIFGFKFSVYAEYCNREFDSDFSLVAAFTYATPRLVVNYRVDRNQFS